MGDLLLVEGEILPLGVKTYSVARDTELNKLLRIAFNFPIALIKISSEGAINQIYACVINFCGSVHLFLSLCL